MAQRLKLLAAAATAAVLAGSAAAQTVRETTTTTTTEVRKGSALMNVNVAVEGGATVGRISDFVISDGGCIEYVVVDSDNRFVLVPFQAVQFDPGRHIVQVNIARDKWRDIPTFTGTNWPVHDQNYISRVRSTFGVRESGYRGGDRGDRQPLDRGGADRGGVDRRQDRRDDRREDRGTTPPRSGVDNPNRSGNVPPTGTRPPADTGRPGDNNSNGRSPPDTNRGTDTNRGSTTDRGGRVPPPPPPGTPGTPGTDRPPV